LTFHATPRRGLQVGVSVGSTLAGRFLGLHGPDDAAFQRRKTVNLAHGLDVVETSPLHQLLCSDRYVSSGSLHRFSARLGGPHSKGSTPDFGRPCSALRQSGPGLDHFRVATAPGRSGCSSALKVCGQSLAKLQPSSSRSCLHGRQAQVQEFRCLFQ